MSGIVPLMADRTTKTMFTEDRNADGERVQFICTPSNREMAPMNTRPFGREHLTEEERAELEELGLWDAVTEDGQPLILGVLNGRFGSGGIVTLNRTLFPDDDFAEACRKKRGEIEAWRRTCMAGVPSGAVAGEAGHPDWGSKYDKAVVFLSLDVVQDETYDRVVHAEGRVAVMNTEAGRKIAAARKVGIRIGSSLRGFGYSNYVTLDKESPWWKPNPKWHGEDITIVREFEFDRDPFDMVDDPATPGCWMESVRKEQTMKLDDNGESITEETSPPPAAEESAATEEAAGDDVADGADDVAADGDTQSESAGDDDDVSGDDDTSSDVDEDADGDSAQEESTGGDDDVDVDALIQQVENATRRAEQASGTVDKQREEIDGLKRELADANTARVELAKQVQSLEADKIKLSADVTLLTEARDRLAEQIAAKDDELKAFAQLKREQARDKAFEAFAAGQKWNPIKIARFRTKVEKWRGWSNATAEQATEHCTYLLDIESDEKSTPPAEGYKSEHSARVSKKHPELHTILG